MRNYISKTFRSCIAAILLFILLPIILICMFMIWVDSKGNVIFKQVRIGRYAKPFTIYKLRTMVDTLSIHKDSLFDDKNAYVTRVGHVLRTLKFDEFFQLLNVLKGDMNFIGPRPLREKLHQFYVEKIPDFQDRYKVLPGLTGLAQIIDLDEKDRPLSVACDLYYINHRSLKLDMLIVMGTIIYLFHNISKNLMVCMKNHWLDQVEVSDRTPSQHDLVETAVSSD